jgi:hypothetical protein
MFDPDDVVACCANDPTDPNYLRDQWIRNLFQITYDGGLKELLSLISGGPQVWQEAYAAFLSIQQDIFNSDTTNVSPHHRFWLTVPFAAQGDTRTNSEVMLDYFNNFASKTPYQGTHLQYVTRHRPSGPNRTVTVTGGAWWTHVIVPQDYTALSLQLNCYDANKNLIATVTDPNASIVNPVEYQLDPITLSSAFITPPGTASVAVVCDVAPATTDTGTVWFANDHTVKQTN